jgi:hypothetical protein
MKNWVIVILFIGLFLAVLRMFNLQEGNESLNGYIEHQSDSMKVWKDKYDRVHAERNILELDRNRFKSLYAEEIAEDFEVKAKQIESVTTITTTRKNSVKIPIETGKGTFVHRDKWINIGGKITDGLIELDIQNYDSIRFVTIHKKRLFRPDIYSVQAISYNPSTIFTSLDRVEIRPRKKRFSLGAGVVYTPTGFNVGIGLYYNLIQF